MKVYALYFLIVAVLISPSLHAQVNKTSSQSNQAKGSSPTNQTNTRQQPTMSQAADSIKFAVTDFKKSMNTLFNGNKNKKDTIQIFVSDVEYDDANLAALKESLKKIKGGKFVNMQYKASNAVLEVSYKGNSTQLWDELPADSKKAFKIVEANDNNLTLAVRK